MSRSPAFLLILAVALPGIAVGHAAAQSAASLRYQAHALSKELSRLSAKCDALKAEHKSLQRHREAVRRGWDKIMQMPAGPEKNLAAKRFLQHVERLEVHRGNVKLAESRVERETLQSMIRAYALLYRLRAAR